MLTCYISLECLKQHISVWLFAHLEGKDQLSGFTGWCSWGLWVVMEGWGCWKSDQATTNQCPRTCAIKHQVFSLSFSLYFVFVFFFYDPLSCTWSLFISQRGKSEAAHIHIHMYKQKIRPFLLSLKDTMRGGRKEQLKRLLWWLLLLKAESQR